MTLTLLAYVVTAFVVHPDWGRLLRETIVPHIVILTTGATLHASGHTHIETAAEAAAALQPLAGGAAGLLFALGVIGTGLIGVPVLAGSAAYAVVAALVMTTAAVALVWIAIAP